MSNQVQAFQIRAYPAYDHLLYHEFQTAQIVIYVGEDDKSKSVAIAKQKLDEEKWVPIKFESKSTLIEKRIEAKGGPPWEAYKKAKYGEVFFIYFLEEDYLYSSKSGISPILPPRITEDFIDDVILKAGGHRLSPKEANPDETRNPDYRLDNYLIELKDLQKEGLNVESRRKKLAIFLRNSGGMKNLSNIDYRKLLDILGGPVKNKVRLAAHQIREAKEYIGDNSLHGGLLYLNSGYYTLPHELFCDIVEKMAKQYQAEIDLVMCVSNMVNTNGFESMVNFAFYPGKGKNTVESKIHAAFLSRVGYLMNDWAKEGFKNSSNPAIIRKPYVFESGGEYYGFEPEPLTCSINENKK